MASVVVASGQAPVVAQEPLPGEKYKKAYKILGIMQVTIGALAFILAIVNIGVESNGYYTAAYGLTIVSAGIWTGVLAFTAGVLGIVAGANPDNCRVTGGMVVSIFAAIAAGLMFSIETPATVYSARGYAYWISYSASNNTAAIHGILSALAFIELVVAIVHSAYCCAAGCCHTYSGRVLGPPQTIVTTTTYPNQLPVTAIPGQQIQYVQQPGVYIPAQQVQGQPMYQQPLMAQPASFPPQQQPTYSNMPTNQPPPQYTEKAGF